MAGPNPLHPPPLLQIPPRPPPPLPPPALNVVPPHPLLAQLPQPLAGQQHNHPRPAVRPPIPPPPPEPDADGNIGILLDPSWFHVVIMKCTASVHEGRASVTLDRWQGTWSFLPNEFVESALHASSGLQIKHLILKQHHLSKLPPNFSSLQTGLPSSLTTLDLSHNQFTALPVVVCDLTALKELFLSHNHIVKIPNQIANLAKLETLHLQGNQLSILPPSVCSLQSLRILNAEDNVIENIPSEIYNLTQLKTLYLKCNRISCLPFPDKFTQLKNLEELHLSNNNLKCVQFTWATLFTTTSPG